MSTKSSVSRKSGKRPQKPAKPYPDFPLSPHASGRWCKRIKGKLYYFGPWRDPQAALRRYLDQKDDLYAGRAPRRRTSSDGPSVADVVNRFLAAKQSRVASGELSPVTWDGYLMLGRQLVELLGRDRRVEDLTPDDFERLRGELSQRYAPSTLATRITHMRSMFKFAFDMEMISKPVRMGLFTRPSKKALRRHRRPKMFEASELRAMLDVASPKLKAMLLLALNCGLSAGDLARLPIEALDLESGWLDHPRAKTGVEHRVPLWPETIEALRGVLARRPEPATPPDATLVFLTSGGRTYWRDSHIGARYLSRVFSTLMRSVGLPAGDRRGIHTCRHVLETIGGETRDQVAVNAVMGHIDQTIAETYRESISDDRLHRVVNAVRGWLYMVDDEPSILRFEARVSG